MTIEANGLPPARRRDQLLLAWAVRSHPEGRALLLQDIAARDRARAAGGSDEDRLLHWVGASGAAQRLRPAVFTMLGTGRAVVFVLLVLALLGGVAAGASALETGPSGMVDIPLAILSLVGVQLLFLLLWLALCVAGLLQPGLSPMGWGRGVPGRLTVFLLERIGGWLPGSDGAKKDRVAASAAMVALLGQRRYGQWLLGAVTHGVWLAFSLGALGSAWLLLVTVQYDFAWGTTLLAEPTAATVLAVIAWLPGVLGLPVPDADMVAASRLGAGSPEAHRQVWAQFLLWALLVYGVLPRLILAVVCAGLAVRNAARLRLDQGHPLFQEALIHLRRSSPAQQPLGERPDDVLTRPGAAPAHRRFGTGAYFALVGVELDRGEHWPPHGADWQVIPMQHVRTRAEIRTLLSDLDALDAPPRFVLVLASLARTPDRGAMDLLTDIAARAKAPVLLLLAESDIARDRGIDVRQRAEDWKERALLAGANAVLTADTDRLESLPQAHFEQSLRQAGVE